MKIQRMGILVVLTLLWACNGKEKATKDKTTKSKVDSIFHVLDERVPEWQKDLNIPNVAIGYIENGEVQKTRVYGDLNSERAPKDMLFNIASITKVVFGTTVMKLVSNGDWDLDEPLYTYFVDEDVKNDPRHMQLTSRHVLSQQSGFVNWRWNHPTEKLTFDFDPGTTFNYSGEGMEYLRKSVQNKLNQSWDNIADSLLFRPMGLQNTSHSWDGKTDFDRFSRFYDSQGKEHVIEDYSSSAQAADEVMTTIDDLTTFGANVINETYLPGETFQEMVTQQTEISDNQDQALAWRLIKNLKSGEYAIHHGGNDIGVATLIVLLPKSKRGLVVLTNADAGIVMCNNVVRSVFEEGKEIIHRAYRSGSPDDIPQPIDVPNEILESYVGIYEQPSGREVDISNTGKTLLMKMPGVPNFQLYPEKENLFFLLDFDPKIKFEKQDDDTYHLKIIEGENIIECKKIN